MTDVYHFTFFKETSESRRRDPAGDVPPQQQVALDAGEWKEACLAGVQAGYEVFHYNCTEQFAFEALTAMTRHGFIVQSAEAPAKEVD